MAGHSKWNNIQHRKGRQDARRGKIFTKLIREITVAAKMGGDDINANSRLRLAVDKAYAQNMTKDTVNRAIKRGAGSEEGSNLEAVRYEGYGPGGVAVIVDCLTDNKNRTVADVRHAFTKCGGNLGTDGSVAYLFNNVGLISFTQTSSIDELMEIAIDSGADDIINNDDGSVDVITPVSQFTQVKQTLETSGFNPDNAELTFIATTDAVIDDEEQASKLLRLNEMLEDLDDVQQVYTNADIDTALLEKL